MTKFVDTRDDQLLQQLCRDSKSAANAASAIFARYGGRLRSLAAQNLGKDLHSRIDPDDILQSAFRTFFRRAARGDYHVPEGDELWRLLVVIGLNKVRSQAVRHRAGCRDVRHTSSDVALTLRSQNDASGVVILRITIEELLESLPSSHSEIVNLRIEGCEVSEIAQRTRRSRRTVERVLQQFRQRLREIIDPDAE